MKIFTYSDYIKSIHYTKRNYENTLEETNTEYKLNIPNQNIDKPHDKLIKDILKDKKEFIELLNKFLNSKEKLKEENINKCINNYITKKYKSKEADIVYKLKNKDIYFLVEHQSTIDYNMPYRILNYCIDIIQEWKIEQKNKKISTYPIVVPIVIYTGNIKWKVPKNYKEQQLKVTTYEDYRIDLKYNLIDVNNYKEEELLEKNTMFGYGMLLEKSKNKIEFAKNIEKIIKKETNKDRLEKISNIVIYLFNNMLQEDKKEKIFEIIEKKVGKNEMESLVKRILENEKIKMNKIENKGKKIGEKSITTQIVKKLIELNQSDEFIKQVTNIKDEELAKIKYS